MEVLRNPSTELLRAATGLGGLRAYQILCSLAISILLARALGPEAFGKYSFIFSIAVLLALPAHVGLVPLTVREIAKYRAGENDSALNAFTRWARKYVIIVTSTIFIGALITALLNTDWTLHEKWSVLLAMSPAIPLFSVLHYQKGVLHGFGWINAAFTPTLMVQTSVFLIIIASLWVSGTLNLLTTVSSQIGALVCALAFSSTLVRKCTSARRGLAVPVHDRSNWARAVLPFSIMGMLGYLNNEAFVPLVGFLSNDEEVAYFRIALSMSLLVAMPLTVVEAVIHPRVSALYTQNNGPELRRIVSSAGAYALLLSIPIIVAAYLFGESIISTLYGKEYIEAFWPIVWLVTAFGLVNLIGPSMLLLHATQFEQESMIVSAVSVIVGAILAFALIPVLGALGGAIALGSGKVFRAGAFRLWAHYKLRKFLSGG